MGKGDAYRPVDDKKYRENYDKIFGKRCIRCNKPCESGECGECKKLLEELRNEKNI